MGFSLVFVFACGARVCAFFCVAYVKLRAVVFQCDCWKTRICAIFDVNFCRKTRLIWCLCVVQHLSTCSQNKIQFFFSWCCACSCKRIRVNLIFLGHPYSSIKKQEKKRKNHIKSLSLWQFSNRKYNKIIVSTVYIMQ